MLEMGQVHVIRHKVLVEGRSVRSVAREMGLSRNTVRKYLRVSEPRRAEGPRSRPVLEEVAPRLEALVAEWSKTVTPKQRITGARLHAELVVEGFEVGATTVRKWWREWRRQRAEVFVPLEYRAGEVAQVDFFEATVRECGECRKVWLFVMRLPYSPRDFVWLYERCDQISFLDGHVRAFAAIGGVPVRIVYDNLSAAVRRIVMGERELTDRFAALVSHYLFEPCFARPGEGHDKGSVEGRGKGIRLQHMVPVPSGESLEAISSALLSKVEGQYDHERWEQERCGMRELPLDAFEARRHFLVRVSRQAMITVSGARYSVPSRWAGLQAAVWLGVDDLVVRCLGEETTLTRVRAGKRLVVYRHYLRELERKPQAVRQVAPLLMRELGEPYVRLWSRFEDRYGGREAGRIMARVLGAVLDHGPEDVGRALEAMLTGDQESLLGLIEHRPAPRVSVPASLACYEVSSGCAADYDVLLGGVQ